MKKLAAVAILGAFALPATAPATAEAACGSVSITEMNWDSAQLITGVSAFLMEQGYGCDVAVVPSDTVPAVTSVAENNEPDIVTELWLNSTGEAYLRLEAEGRIERVANVLEPGGVEGWWIPSYLAEEHPELATLDGILDNPELVGAMFHNCPDGWGCRVVSDNLNRVIKMGDHGIEVFNHGSGETLATSLAAAYQSEEPWFGYYWGPTSVLGRFEMTKVDLGGIDEEVHARNQNIDEPNPGLSDFPPAAVLTSITTDLKEREPEIAELMSKVSFKTDTMSGLLAWKDQNNASVEETVVYFLRNNPETWGDWLSADARQRLSALLD